MPNRFLEFDRALNVKPEEAHCTAARDSEKVPKPTARGLQPRKQPMPVAERAGRLVTTCRSSRRSRSRCLGPPGRHPMGCDRRALPRGGPPPCRRRPPRAGARRRPGLRPSARPRGVKRGRGKTARRRRADSEATNPLEGQLGRRMRRTRTRSVNRAAFQPGGGRLGFAAGGGGKRCQPAGHRAAFRPAARERGPEGSRARRPVGGRKPGERLT